LQLDSSLEFKSLQMRLRFHTKSSYPLNIVLTLEWLLLAVAAISLIVMAINNPAGFFANGLGFITLAGMGLYFPRKWRDKWLYTAVEFLILLLLAFVLGFPLPATLFIVVVIRNCVLFADENLFQRSAITIICFVTCLIAQSLRLWQGRFVFAIAFNQIGLVWMGLAIVFGLVILFLQLLVDTVMIQKRSQEQLRKYALQIEELATVQERNRIARDIHDSLGHSLTIFNIHLEAAIRLLESEPAEAKALLLEVKQIGKKSLQEVRGSVMMLRADPHQGKSLEVAIAHLITDFQKTTGIIPHYIFEVALAENISEDLKVTIYRLVQESLTNIYKHSRASEVAIAIHQTVKAVKVCVKDNGIGFQLNHNPSGFGLQGMRERTTAIAGDLQIKTAPNQGCEIHADFPLPSPLSSF
jgi:signal transduction histidine kinase